MGADCETEDSVMTTISKQSDDEEDKDEGSGNEEENFNEGETVSNQFWIVHINYLKKIQEQCTSMLLDLQNKIIVSFTYLLFILLASVLNLHEWKFKYHNHEEIQMVSWNVFSFTFVACDI